MSVKKRVLAFGAITGFIALNIFFFQNFIPLGQQALKKENTSFDAVHQAVIVSDLEMEDHQDEAYGIGPDEEDEERIIDSRTEADTLSKKDISSVRKPTSNK